MQHFLNGLKLLMYPEKGIITVDEMELTLVKDHDEPLHVSMISRR